RPTKKFGANISYQITQGNAHSDAFSMTNYHLYDESTRDSFLESYDDSNQPHFIKHLVRAQVESQLHDTFGLIAAFSMTQSIIPLRRSNNDHLGSWATPVDPNDQGSATRNQTRQIYNYFLKTYYDPSENVRLELTYTYAPQYDYRFIVGTKDDEYHFDSGGHQLGLKTTWDNGLGTLTHVLGYSFLENSVTTNFHATKYWQASDSKHWSNWATWVRSGGYAPSQSIQHTLGNKLIQDFTPFEFIGTQHVFQAGLEINYQHASFGFSKPYDSAVKTSTFMTQAQQALCAQTNGEWCDTAKAYDPRGFEKLDGVNVVANPHGVGAIWNYGQYFHTITRFVSDRTIALHDVAFAVFFQDDMQIPLGKLGSLNIRAGVRLDTDSYMGKFTAGHRLSLNYEAPWNAGDTGRNFATQLTTGVNRYYGRNLFAYRLADGRNTLKTDIRRNSPDKTWEEVLAEGRICTPRYRDPQTNEWIYDSNCRETYANSVKFESLKVPYVDEFLVGYAQHLYDWNGGIKYIYRAGRDEIRYVRSDYVGLPTDSHYASTYYTYTNEGKSWIHVVTLVIENHKPIEFWGMKHFVLFAFDWNGVKRNFNDYASSATLHQIQDNEIVWEGQVVPYSQRPASNFMRPYTLRLTTTHTFNIGRTKWLWHNFFRYRSDYDAMARIHIAGRQYIGNLAGREHAQYDPAHNDKDQYIAQRIRKAFTWDMRIGFEVTLGKGNILYMNMDIYNVLDAQNPTILTANYAGDSSAPTIGYEVGRQFWIQVGWKL
ncbi:hypothetical protein, partial [Helicobacter sp. MIT 14-3879]|uniref:hypothetical protein n=1 Tax=Helicobacter sp. MIT 14-3879 TaxID=2040649 RepID=UPI000E1E40B6